MDIPPPSEHQFVPPPDLDMPLLDSYSNLPKTDSFKPRNNANKGKDVSRDPSVEGGDDAGLPYSREAEKAVLGAILKDSDSLILIEGLLVAEHFYIDAHKKIYAAIMEISQASEGVDIVIVAEKLREESYSSPFLGSGYLVDLIESAPVAKNIEHYATIVRKNYFLRKMVLFFGETITAVKSMSGSVEQFIEGVEKQFLEISSNYDRSNLLKADVVLESTIEEIQKKLESDGSISGVPTGFINLDLLLGGLQKSDLIILAARPGMGKTALVLNIAINAAFEKKSVAFFTLEMRKEQLMSRLLSSIARVDSSRLTKGELTNEEQDRLMEGARRIYDFRDFLAIDETSGISLMELRSRCRRYHKENGLDLIIIDYLQLMSGSSSADSREREISKISMGLKGLAKELAVPIIALAQLNRGPDQRPDKRPKISDLRESGSMEQDADLIWFVYRDEYYNPDSELSGIAELMVAKNRHGAQATIKLAFQPNFVSFQNLYNQTDLQE